MTSHPIRSQFPIDSRDTIEPAGSSATTAVIYLPAHADAVTQSHKSRHRGTWKFHAAVLPVYALFWFLVLQSIITLGDNETYASAAILAYAVSFPLCWLFPIAPSALLASLGMPPPYFGTAIDNGLSIVAFLAAGYVQWLVAIPRLVRRFFRLRETGLARR